MNTLLNILLGFLIFIFVSVSIVLMSGWIIMQVMHDKINQDDCGCDSCGCDEEIPMLDRPLTKEELKEVNMTPKINDFSKKTEITGMGGVGGPIDTIRGKDIEPREENDPNPNQK
tara:strand:+ start:218 stop:562 length:345 start_codon:yes stop_codon:yes gene_type:complete